MHIIDVGPALQDQKRNSQYQTCSRGLSVDVAGSAVAVAFVLILFLAPKRGAADA